MRGSRFYIIFFSIFIFGNAIFFLSKLFLPSSGGEYFTPPGDVVNIYGHTFTLYRWDYCENTNTMEVELDVENNDFDGHDTYQFSAITSDNKSLDINLIVEESDYIVLQIKGVPKDTNVALQISSEALNDYVKIFGNTYESRKVDILTIKTKNAYLIDRANVEIDGFKSDIKTKNDEIKTLETKISNIDIANQKLREEMKFMTADEAAAAEDKINNNNAKKQQYIEEIENKNRDIVELNYKILFTEEKIEKLQKGE